VLKIDERTGPGMVASKGKPYRENDIANSPFFAAQKRDSASNYAIHKLMCVPLKVHDRVTGVVQVLDKSSGDDFDDDDYDDDDEFEIVDDFDDEDEDDFYDDDEDDFYDEDDEFDDFDDDE
jgi:GAF domain-containing protein